MGKYVVTSKFDLCQSSVIRISGKNRSYKVYLVQELSDDDFGKRLKFDDIMISFIAKILIKILFSDKAFFYLNEYITTDTPLKNQ